MRAAQGSVGEHEGWKPRDNDLTGNRTQSRKLDGALSYQTQGPGSSPRPRPQRVLLLGPLRPSLRSVLP